ncbi:unnamed protein product, partial [Heterosigma akashiwo]
MINKQLCNAGVVISINRLPLLFLQVPQNLHSVQKLILVFREERSDFSPHVFHHDICGNFHALSCLPSFCQDQLVRSYFIPSEGNPLIANTCELLKALYQPGVRSTYNWFYDHQIGVPVRLSQ